MLSMTDVPIDQYLPCFAAIGVKVAFLVPTPTGYEKSIMDATGTVRELLNITGVHNYSAQGQGPQNKVVVKSYFANSDGLTETEASLYRPVTKNGDPRIWFYNLKKYCSPCNLLALIVIRREIVVINLSKSEVANSLLNKGAIYNLLLESVQDEASIANELLEKLKVIHAQGFLRSITAGDPGVGDTLENALGIVRNNSQSPDYKGIELKATRLTRNGQIRATTRSTLFTRVPDVGLTYRQIVEQYGKVQTPRGQSIARLQLYETLRASRPNAYGLILDTGVDKETLDILYQDNNIRRKVSAWYVDNLKQTLLCKHHETFWVKAVSETKENWEYFRYDRVLHTKNPNALLFIPLVETDKITVDLAAHFKPDGGWRDHGILFKMSPDDLPLLLGEPQEYIL